MTNASSTVDTRYVSYTLLPLVLMIVLACSPLGANSTTPEVATAKPKSTDTQISEEDLIATEQAKAMAVKTEGALTRATQPTFTPPPTQTSILAHLPTLTPIPNSTPVPRGAFFDVPADVLGSRYEIENACYFDTQSGWERYEIYAGAIAGSGDKYSAQGVVVVRVLQVTEKDDKPFVEIANTKEYLTHQKRGSLHLPLWDECPNDWMTLRTSLNFGWILNPVGGDFYQDDSSIPIAIVESGGQSQLAEHGSFCWNNSCASGGAIRTSPIPLVIPQSMLVTLRLPLDEPPDSLELDALLISPPGSLLYDSDVHENHTSWNYEEPGRAIQELGALPLKREQEIRISLEPGYYVLMVSATWREYGSVTYGFLVEVK